MHTDYLRRVFRWLHIVWAIIGAGICTLLATATGGHPPGLVFVPIAAAIWLAGHILLWASRRLAIRGKHAADTSITASETWPPTLILLLLLFGIVFIFGLSGIVWQILFERDRLGELAIPLAVWLPSSLCFAGILLRQDWSRILAGSGFIVVAAILLYEMIASLMRGYRNSNAEWLAALVIVAVLILIGQHILRSPRIKAFCSRS